MARRFVLAVLDPATECPVSEWPFKTGDLGELARLADANPAQLAQGYEFFLEGDEVQQIAAAFGIQLEQNTGLGLLRPWHHNDELPYLIHTDRELALMLAGTKPFAHFSDVYPSTPGQEIIPERLFDPYVLEGRFVKREFVDLLTEPPPKSYAHLRGHRRVLYALNDEAWRIEAFIDLLAEWARNGWSEELERKEGSLLGYEDWQTDIHIERQRQTMAEYKARQGEK
jgi:hypothetical protein